MDREELGLNLEGLSRAEDAFTNQYEYDADRRYISPHFSFGFVDDALRVLETIHDESRHDNTGE